MLRGFYTAWKTGLTALIPVVLVYGAIFWIVNFLTKLEVPFYESVVTRLTEISPMWLRFFIIGAAAKLAFFLVVLPVAFGFLLRRKCFRRVGSALAGKLPLVGSLFLFLFSDELAERQKRNRGVPEVVFRRAGDWVPGLVVNEFSAPRGWVEGEVIQWLVVVSLQSGFTYTNVPADDVILTGRSMADYLMGVTSFGLAFKIEADKLRRYTDVY